MSNGQKPTYLIDHNGQTIECDRVTNVLGATKASAGLALWYGREERKAWIENISRLIPPIETTAGREGSAFGEIEHFISSLKDDDDDLFASRLRDKASGSGTVIHALVNADATGCKIPDDMHVTEEDWRRYMLWEDFKTKEGITYVDSEMRVWSPVLQVAGTMDLSVMWKGKLWGMDTKTGTLKRDAATQQATYWMLRHETIALREKNFSLLSEIQSQYAKGLVPLVPWAPLGILHIGDDKVEIYEIDPKENENLARNFLYRLQIYRDDQRLRPFRRLYPPPRMLKSGEFQEVKWLRAS